MGNIKDYWSTVHKNSIGRYLTGTSGTDVWKELGIYDIIQPKKDILNIGIGFGVCTRELKTHDVNVYGLDICIEAIDRVKDILSGYWLDEDLESLPVNFFDLAISHLVSQHMSDDALNRQLKYVIRSLKEDGIFAIQFLTRMTNQDPNKNKDEEGINVRSVDQMEEMVRRNNGEVIKKLTPIKFNNVILDDVLISATWDFFQIKKV